MDIDYCFSQKRTLLYEFEVMHIKCNRNDVKIILYLNTIINNHLWKLHNRCVYEGCIFDFNDIVSRLIKSVGAQKRLQSFMFDLD